MASDPPNPDKTPQPVIASSLQYGMEGVRDPRVARAVDLLLQGATYGEVAAALNVDRSTLWDLRRKHNIDEIVAEMAMDIVDASYRRNLAVTREAVATLIKVMRDAEKPSDRMAAAKELLAQQRQDARIAAYARARGVDLSSASTDDLVGIVEAEAESG